MDVTWDLPADPTFWPSSDGVPIETNEPEDLEEVVEARRAGFGVIGPEPRMWDWLWIFWPVSHRGWVVDRRVRTSRVHPSGGADDEGEQPWSCAEYADIENEASRRFSEFGLPHRPMGRLWLARPPSGSPDLESFLTELAEILEQRGERLVLTPSLMTSAREVLELLFRNESRIVW